jgi:hypothetical protein
LELLLLAARDRLVKFCYGAGCFWMLLHVILGCPGIYILYIDIAGETVSRNYPSGHLLAPALRYGVVLAQEEDCFLYKVGRAIEYGEKFAF